MDGHMMLGICRRLKKNSEADWWVPLANNNRTAHPVLHNEQREVSNYVLIPSHISRLDNNPKAV
jgi:hypothetical protein